MSDKALILNRIQEAIRVSAPQLIPKPDFLTEAFIDSPEEHIEVIFAENFKKNRGEFLYAESIEDALLILKNTLKTLQSDILPEIYDTYLQELCSIAAIQFTPSSPSQNNKSCETGILMGELLIAQSGGLVISYPKNYQETFLVRQPKNLIILAFSSQLVYDTQSALLILKENYNAHLPGQITFIHGINRGAFEGNFKEINLGGYQDLLLLLIDDINEEFRDSSQ